MLTLFISPCFGCLIQGSFSVCAWLRMSCRNPPLISPRSSSFKLSFLNTPSDYLFLWSTLRNTFDIVIYYTCTVVLVCLPTCPLEMTCGSHCWQSSSVPFCFNSWFQWENFQLCLLWCLLVILVFFLCRSTFLAKEFPF